ncbi:MAG: nickel-responsive transcriptional regulator NikR [Spirochaetes bacterium]|nr:nickel-responsive transcriptional regulator NikR [Spirochaetota bacterium]
MLRRFSISLDENLLEKFDKYLQIKKYTNRSEAIRDLIRDVFVKEEWETDKEVFGVITFIFDHHQPKIQEKITELQHDFNEHIVSATHVHIDHHNCLEVVIVSGRAKNIRELHEKIKALRGLKNANLIMSSTGTDLA